MDEMNVFDYQQAQENKELLTEPQIAQEDETEAEVERLFEQTLTDDRAENKLVSFLKSEQVRLVYTLVIICVAVSVLLAGVNLLTRDKIALIQKEKADEARNQVLAAQTYEKEDVAFKNSEITEIYAAKNGSEAVGKCISVTVKGSQDDISLIVGITADGEVSGVKIVAHAETAGLGALAVKEEFLSQYKGEGAFTVVKGESAEGEISAISGATVTSKAVTLGVNIALAEFSGRSFEQ